MQFENFLNQIDFIKDIELPGKEAHYKMVPSFRKQMEQLQMSNQKNAKEAATLALLYPNKKNNLEIVLTKRAQYKGTHSAQISFPGGKKDAIDSTFSDTALRETEEEIGVLTTNITLVKKLSELYIPPSNFMVYPFLGYTTQEPHFIPNHEVDKIIKVSVQELLSENNLSVKKIQTSYAKNVEVPCFVFDNEIVWGATAMMLSELKELIKKL